MTVADGQVIGQQPVGIDVYLVLLDKPPDRGDVGDPGHGLELIADIPVLEAPELGEVVLGRSGRRGHTQRPSPRGSRRDRARA